MPKNRNELEHDQKVVEILESAEQQLKVGGYDALSVAALARSLGVAPNALYWYFPSKDALFVAVLRRKLERLRAEKPGAAVEWVERIVWYVDHYQPLFELRTSAQARAGASEVISAFNAELDAMLSRMLSGALKPHVDAEELPEAVSSFRAMVVGAYVQRLNKHARSRLLRYALARWSR